MTRVRLDKLLVDKGLVPSRARAQALIMAGEVLVDDTPITKAGQAIDEDAKIRLRGRDHPFVSRGGVKLDGALEDLAIDVHQLIVLDVGASTGGFTDVCLRRGAKQVYAVDVGTNQLAYALRVDPRVTNLEKTNARNLTPEMLPSLVDLAIIDVSFISTAKILPPVVACLVGDGAVLAMVKPQFEAGRSSVGKGGVVRDEAAREAAIESVIQAGNELGLHFAGRAHARIKGPKGNQETFVYLVKKSGLS